MDYNSIISFFKKPENIINEVTSISSLAPKVLTSDSDLAKVQPYIDKLKDTLNAKGINNIALTGGYGSGKSTLLKTFQHLHRDDFKFLNISLAAFNQTKVKENFKDIYEIKIKNGKSEKEAEKEIVNDFKETIISNNEVEKQLEISILQQIIYKVKPSNLPESRFKRIVNISMWKLYFFIPFGFVIWVLSLILLFKYNYLDKINPNTWIYKNDIDWSSIFIFIFAFSGIGYFSKLVVELFSNSKINKVNLKGEIEIGDDSNKSILNEHYDEILYYFEKNDFNVVVIEDLDRFDNTNIFTKLRELNILLNNADTIRNKHAYKNFGIKFLYAVGDDLFNDKKERVKFFEYIIPVIPFINSSNANDQLKALIKESDLEENVFPKEFLSDITTFIDDIDMRLLINIFHEFVIYRNILKPDVVSGREAELFAMITYKNIDPEDFNKLNSKEGKLYKLINEKKEYVKKLIATIDTKIINKKTEISNIEDENISDIEELKPIYLIKISGKIDNATSLCINNSRLRFSDLMQNEVFNEVINSTNFRYYHNGGGTYTSNLSFRDIEKEVNPDFTYKERAELIENKNSNKIDLIQKGIEKLKTEKTEIENWDLKQIFKEIDINQYLNDFSNNGLLRNLILEGYINENYIDYISLFHEISLTKEDKKFERNVKSGINEGFDFELTHIENLIDNHLELKYFERETILNFDLLDYLAKNYSRYSKKYDTIIKLLSNEKEKSIQFIDEYIKNEERPIQIFIEKLVENWKTFWNYIFLECNYTNDKLNKYLELIIRFSKIEDILKNNDHAYLIHQIEENTGFLSLIKNREEFDYFDKITKLLKKLNVEFKKLDNPNEETEKLFNYVYNNNLYRINEDNLLQMLLLFGKENIEEFNRSNYSTILKSECKPLIDYINSKITTYIESVYLKLDDNRFEEEISLIKLLNNENLNSKSKVKVIQKVETLICDLSKIEDIEIKKQLLTNLKVVANWKNVIDYYSNCENKIDEKLVEYLNSEKVINELSKLKLTKDDTKFELNLVVCNEINDKIYNNLLDSCYYIYPTLSFENVNFDKAVILANRKLTTTKSNYDKLRENFADNHITLIERDFDKFFEKIEDFETDADDILMILKSDKITIYNRFKYVSKLTEQTIIDNKAIAKKVGEIILSKSTKVEFEFNVVESIIKSLDSTENKVKFINLYFTGLSNENIISLVKSLSYNHNELFIKQHKPKFNDIAYNVELLTKLKSKGLIRSFDIDKKDKTLIRAVANY